MVVLAFLMLVYFTPQFQPAHGLYPPTGTNFDHIVVLAMENTPYSAVFGDGTYGGCPTSTDPFLCDMLRYGTSFTHYAGGATNINGPVSGCSAGCYVALTAGSSQSVTDSNECGANGNACTSPYTFANIVSLMTAQGLSFDGYCEYGSSSCPRGSNHFPFKAYDVTNHGNCFDAGSCSMIFGGTSTSCFGHSCSTTDLVNAANTQSAPNLLWYTPTDSHNMHDNSVSSGDTYLKNFLVGSGGSIANPQSGSLLATSLFNLSQRTLLLLWWDECSGTNGSCDSNNDTPNLFYDPQGVAPGKLITTTNKYDEYSILRLIEDNWNLGQLTGSACSSGNTFDNCAIGMKAAVFPTPISTAPDLVGWGGVRLDEVGFSNSTNIVSNVSININGHASNFEQVVFTMWKKGLNTIRVDFDPYCTDSQASDKNDMSWYSSTNLQNAITIASHYGFWLVVDYHGYTDIFQNETCWINFWFGSNHISGVVGQFYNSYSQIIWEPNNEPENTDCNQVSSDMSSSCATPNSICASSGSTYDSSCMPVLGSRYNDWVSYARAIGDTHWIVAQNLCSYSCSSVSTGDGNGIGAVGDYPLVTDSQYHILLSLHSYMGWCSYSTQNTFCNGSGGTGSWSTSAGTVAAGYFRTALGGVAKLGYPSFNSEGGADPLCTSCAVDQVLTGSAGYSTTTDNFIQALTNFYTNSSMHVGFTWWTAGSWTNTVGAFQYGALQCNVLQANRGWGCLLSYPFPTTTTLSPTTAYTTIAALVGYIQTLPFVVRNPPLLTGLSSSDGFTYLSSSQFTLSVSIAPQTYTSAYSTTIIITLTVTALNSPCPGAKSDQFYTVVNGVTYTANGSILWAC